MNNTETAKPEKSGSSIPRKRSPNFPGISLPKAIERARQVYEVSRAHPVPAEKIIVSYWKYTSSNSGPASVTYAALKRYGLLVDQGKGEERLARLTDLAIDVLHANPNQQEAIKTAALTPGIFREWWDKYGDDLPSYDTLEYQYIVKGPFAEEGFKTFLRAYQQTIAFAKLSKSDSAEDAPAPDLDTDSRDEPSDASDEEGEPAGEQPNAHMGERRKPKPGVVSISLPLPTFGPSEPVVIEFPGKVPESDWEYFVAVISAMKAGVVEEPDK